MHEDRTVLKEYVNGGPVRFVFEVRGHGELIKDGDETSRLVNPLTNCVVPIYYHPRGVPFIQQKDKNKAQTTLVKPISAEYLELNMTPPQDQVIDVSGINHMWLSEMIPLGPGDRFEALGHIEVYDRHNKQGVAISQSYCFTRTSEYTVLEHRGE